MGTLRLLFLSIISLLAVACQPDQGYAVHAINGTWPAKKTVNFMPTVKQRQGYQIKLLIRNNNDYPYSNIRFFVEMKQNGKPFGKRDTLNITLAKPDGTWLGSGMGAVKTLETVYTTQTLPAGKYQISVQQAMRANVLPGIEDLGLKIIPSTK